MKDTHHIYYRFALGKTGRERERKASKGEGKVRGPVLPGGEAQPTPAPAHPTICSQGPRALPAVPASFLEASTSLCKEMWSRVEGKEIHILYAPQVARQHSRGAQHCVRSGGEDTLAGGLQLLSAGICGGRAGRL